MRRFLIALGITSCLLFIFVAPLPANAALVPIVCQDPEHCGTCEFVELINNVIQFILIVSSGVAVLIFIFAGFRLLFSGGNVQAATAARSMLTNVIIGYVIILAAFLIIDTVMGFLLPGNSPNLGWKTVECVYPIEAHETPRPTGSSVSLGGGGAGGPLVQCPPGNVGCSVEALQAAGFSERNANIMSCIAMTESSGNPRAHSVTNACGIFQVVRSTWNSYASGACSNFSSCENTSCNIQVTKTLVERNGFRDWTCPGCNAKAQKCITQYGG